MLTLTSARVTDYSQAKYIPIIDGRILVWGEFAFVTHSTNLSVYKRVVEETSGMTSMFPLSHMHQLLWSAKGAQIDSGHLYEMLLSRNMMLTTELQNLLLAKALA